MSNAQRTSRVEARIAPEALRLVRRAAEIQGRSVSDFVTAAAYEAAVETVQRHHVIELTPEDQLLVAELLLREPPPSSELDRAADAHRRLVQIEE